MSSETPAKTRGPLPMIMTMVVIVGAVIALVAFSRDTLPTTRVQIGEQSATTTTDDILDPPTSKECWLLGFCFCRIWLFDFCFCMIVSLSLWYIRAIRLATCSSSS